MSNELAVSTESNFLPVMHIETAVQRFSQLAQFVGQIMKDGKDFGTIPGTGDKLTLLKPGAEKLTTFFGLSPEFILTEKETDWTGKDHDGEPFFYFHYRCRLSRAGALVGEGLGGCNSWETKYRFRNAEKVCPNCGKSTIIKGKAEYGGGWLCFGKKGGCGAKFRDGDAAIESQPSGKVKHDNPADLVNTIDKMAQKRALIAATLIAVNASEFFTQDIEDYVVDAPVIDITPPSAPVASEPVQVTTPPAKPQPREKLTFQQLKEKFNAYCDALVERKIYIDPESGDHLPVTMHEVGEKTPQIIAAIATKLLDGNKDFYHAALYNLTGKSSANDITAIEAAGIFKILFNGTKPADIGFSTEPIATAAGDMLVISKQDDIPF